MGAIPTAGTSPYPRRWRSPATPDRFGVIPLVAATACLAGMLLPGWWATMVIVALLALDVVAFTFRRAARLLDRILREELSEPPADQ